jgi:diaminopimelate epimerase
VIPFVKMHGCGNDFLVVREADLLDGRPEDDRWRVDPQLLARRSCDRHFGVGADGLLVYGPRPARDGLPHLRMRYWNADGSPAAMCGNGARCVVRLACERDEVEPPLVLDTDAGPRPARVVLRDGVIAAVEIDMGPPAWEPDAVPVLATAPLLASPLRAGEHEFAVTAVSMGNPHAVVAVPDLAALAAVSMEDAGRALAHHPLFPAGANASFVAVADGALHLRVWERGAGPTLACGTATCAAFATVRRLGLLAAQRAAVHVPGGIVEVRQDDAGHLWLSGPAAYIAEGSLATELLGT